MKTQEIQYLLITRSQYLSETCPSRKQWENLNQRMMGRHQTQWETLHIPAVLPRMIVIETIWSGHGLSGNGQRAAAGKSPECI